MANVAFYRGTGMPTTDKLPDGGIYFCTSPSGANNIIVLNSGGTLFTYRGTDTTNTAGSTNTSSKIYLVGTERQQTRSQTYSHDTVYVGTDGYLYSGSAPVYSGWITFASSPVTYSTFISKTSYSSIRELKPTRVWCKLVNVPLKVFYPGASSSPSAFTSDLIYERTVGLPASNNHKGAEYMLVSTVAAGEGGITYQSWLGWTTDYFTNYYLYVDKDGTFASHPMLNGDSNLFTVKKNYLYVCGYQF